MRKLAGLLVLSVAARITATATLVVVIPAKEATVVCADRRFTGTAGNQFDSDAKLQLLPPHAIYFIVGLEAVSEGGRVVYAPGTVFRKFLAERENEGIPPDRAIRNSAEIEHYLRDSFGEFLGAHRIPPPGSAPFAIKPIFTLGILRTENHDPRLTTITVSQNAKKPSTAVSNVSRGMERFGVDSAWPGSIFARSDPMYIGQTEVILGLARRDRQFSRFAPDPYVKKFLLADFGLPLTDRDTALDAAKRLISVTAEGFTAMPDAAQSISKDSVCAVLDYLNETAQYK
ncbi:MAG: hypothetical protein ABSG41_18745 [Bryobacteraceae bacterium]|jgi:hypothetical protein